MDRLWIFCADIGSVAASRFGWASLDTSCDAMQSGSEIEALADRVAERLEIGDPVALGFECRSGVLAQCVRRSEKVCAAATE